MPQHRRKNESAPHLAAAKLQNKILHRQRPARANQPQINDPSASTTTGRPANAETVNPIYEYSDEMNAATMLEMAQRQTHLWEACAKLDLIGRHTPNAWEFVLSPGHSLSWCNVFKAASSTWLYYFNILGECGQLANVSLLSLTITGEPFISLNIIWKNY